MAIYRVNLNNIDDAADPGKTIISFLETNMSLILAQNVQTTITIERLS